MFSCCQQPADRQRAGKEEYSQTVPSPSVKASKSENRSSFIVSLDRPAERTGWTDGWKMLSQLFLGACVLHVPSE